MEKWRRRTFLNILKIPLLFLLYQQTGSLTSPFFKSSLFACRSTYYKHIYQENVFFFNRRILTSSRARKVKNHGIMPCWIRHNSSTSITLCLSYYKQSALDRELFLLFLVCASCCQWCWFVSDLWRTFFFYTLQTVVKEKQCNGGPPFLI